MFLGEKMDLETGLRFTKQRLRTQNVSNSMVVATSDWTESLTTNSTFNLSSLTHTSQEDVMNQAACFAFEFYFYAVAVGVLGLLGLVGNSMSFVVMCKDRGTPVATFLLQVLSIADNCFLLLWMIIYSVKSYLRYFYPLAVHHPSYIYTRVYTFPFLYMAQMETIWLTVVIALNRYMAVCMPYKAPHLCTIMNVYKEVIIVTVFSICINIPRFFEIEITKKFENGTTVVGWERTELGNNAVYARLYTDALYYLFSFVLPLLILAFVNTRVTVAYQAARKRKRRMTSRRSENENNITLVMIVIVLIFILCQAPARIVQLVTSYGYSHCHQYKYYIIHISNTLEVLNSSVNFLIYFLCRKRFRDIIITHFCNANVSSAYRRDSAKATTTEGLSLGQFEQTNTADRCNSIKEATEVVQDHVSIHEEHDISNVDTHVDDDDKQPLNVFYKPPEHEAQKDICEQAADINILPDENPNPIKGKLPHVCALISDYN